MCVPNISQLIYYKKAWCKIRERDSIKIEQIKYFDISNKLNLYFYLDKLKWLSYPSRLMASLQCQKLKS